MTDTRKRVSLLDAIDDAMTEPTSTGSVYLDGAVWAKAKALKAELAAAKKADEKDPSLQSNVPRLTSELDQLMATLSESELVFTFRQLPKLDLDALIAKHPDDGDGPWNDETFPPAIVHAACIGVTGAYEAPGVTVEEVAGLWERLGQRQTDELFGAAFYLQYEAPKPFTYAATGPTPGSGLNSTTATS